MSQFLMEPPQYRFECIHLDSVDFPDSFLRFLHDGHIEQAALEPIRALGQIHPLPVHEQDNGRFHLLGEYPSFVVLKKLGLQTGIVQIVPVSTPPLTLYALQILHDLPAVQANPILQAYVLRQAHQNLSREELPSLLALLGYNDNSRKIKDLIALLDLASEAVLALHRGLLSPKTGKQLTKHTREDQRCIVELIVTYRLGGSKQQKLIELLTELTLRDQQPVRHCIAQWREGRLSTTENLPQQVQELLAYLSAKSAPASTRAKESFQTMVRQLRPPNNITIDHSLSFEDERLNVHLDFASKEALMEKWEQLKKIMTGTNQDDS
jgi:ParB family transcriptional regulator, chromosome partitioning protein